MFLFYILEWEGNFSLYCFLLKTESGKQLLLKYNSHAKRSKFLEMLKSISKVKPNFMTNTSVRWKVKNVHARKQCTLQVIYVICQKRGRVLYHDDEARSPSFWHITSRICEFLFSFFFSLNWSTGFKFFFENAMRSNRVLRSEIKATKCIVFFRWIARLQRETSRNILVTHFMEEILSCVPPVNFFFEGTHFHPGGL